MRTRRVSITLPEQILARADTWAHRQGKSRSRVVADALDTVLRDLAEQEVTRLYDEACASADAQQANLQLAEEMRQMAPPEEDSERW